MGLEALSGRDSAGGVAAPDGGLMRLSEKCARFLTVPETCRIEGNQVYPLYNGRLNDRIIVTNCFYNERKPAADIPVAGFFLYGMIYSYEQVHWPMANDIK